MHIKLKDFTIQSDWWNLYGFSIVFTVTSPLIIKNHQHHSILLALSIQYFDIIPRLSSHSRINLTQNNTNEQISKQESRKQKYEDAKEKRSIFSEEKRRGGGEGWKAFWIRWFLYLCLPALVPRGRIWVGYLASRRQVSVV